MKSWSCRRKVVVGILASFVFVLLVGILMLTVFRQPILRAAGGYLVVEGAPVEGDAVLLLNGDPDSRAVRTAQLYKRGLAAQILIARAEDSPTVERGIRPNDTSVSLQLLRDSGVPEEAITEMPGGRVGSTWDEAKVLAQWAADNPLDRVLVVTTRLHSRRTRWALRRALRPLDTPPELVMLPADHWDFDAEQWWRSERGVLFVFNEYVKLFYYRWTYD